MTWKNRWLPKSIRRGAGLFIISSAIVAALIFLLLPAIPEIPSSQYPSWMIVLVPALFAAGVSVFLDWVEMFFQKSQLREERIQRLGEQQYRRMVQGVEDYAIYMLDPEGYVISWNDGSARIKGYEEDEIIGEHFSIFYPQDAIDAGMAEEHLDRAREEGRSRSEGWRVRKDGSRFWADVLMVPVYEDRGELIGFTKITRDITRWHEVRRDLEQSKQRLAEAQRIANIGSWELDLNSKELVWSDHLYRMLGFEPGEFEPTAEKFLELVHPDDHERVEDELRAALINADVFQYEHSVLCPDGEVRIWHARGRVELDEHDRPIRMIGINEDITERRELQEAFTLQANLNESIVKGQDALGQGALLIEDDRILFANEVMTELLEVEPGSIETVPQLIAALGIDSVSNLARALNPQAYNEGATTSGLISLNGENEKHLEYASTSIDVHNHHHIVLLIKDITQRVEYERKLRDSSEKLRRSYAQMSRAIEDERARISREIHDELGQHLTGLKMDLSLLRSELAQKTEAMGELIDTTVQDVRRLATELRPGILDDLGLVAALEWQTDEFEKRTGINCQIEADPEITVPDDEITTAVFRIFQESLTNVARHAAAQNVEISLKVDEDDVLELKVADDGRGLSDDTLHGEGSISLGLLGMRERAEMFGGETLIAPGELKGTIVRVRVPLDGNKRGEA